MPRPPKPKTQREESLFDVDPMFLDDEGRGLRFPLVFDSVFGYPGSKGSLYKKLPWVKPHLPSCKVWVEPFAGSAGAMMWALDNGMRPDHVLFGEANAGTRRFWRAISRQGALTSVKKANKLSKQARRLIATDLEEAKKFYYARREAYNKDGSLSDYLYLIRNSFNNLVRFNSKGEFNAPCGYTTPKDAELVNLKSVESLQELIRTGMSMDVKPDWARVFIQVRRNIQTGVWNPEDIIFSIDPPYFPTSKTASFTGYSGTAFGAEKHEELALAIREVSKMGVRWILHGNDEKDGRLAYKKCKGMTRPLNGVQRIIGNTATSQTVTERLWYSKNWK